MWRAEIRDGYVYLKDTQTGQEKPGPVETAGCALSAEVTDDDEVTITADIGGYKMPTKYRISNLA